MPITISPEKAERDKNIAILFGYKAEEVHTACETVDALLPITCKGEALYNLNTKQALKTEANSGEAKTTVSENKTAKKQN